MSAWVAACLLAAAAPAWPAAQRSESEEARVQDIFGWVEWVEIGASPIRLKAKLDTGATTSSLTADDIEIFRRDGKRHVRFTILDEDSDIEETIEARLVRHVRIRRHDGSTQRRPVVRLGMCLGDIFREHEFTLVDRSSFLYPVLVGRNYMRGHVLVDSGETFTRRPSCKQRSSSASPGMDRVAALRLEAP
ncbi:ATP-dependent zinc protease [Luteimonas sp. R10]|uniref:ATP-dependent zinc protease family protein n=1 Tax=Luteimonas sp. R10 TaxID=3108176 RepID=UPI00308BFD4B|nr:RimK/LysX family protein [Luteimonas sp. R10]